MIDLIKNTAGLDGRPIERWAVAYSVPQLGIFPTVAKAVEGILDIMPDADPRLLITPVPIAMVSDGTYEVYNR